MSTIPKLDELETIDLLLGEGRRLRYEDPREMAELSSLALAVARRLDHRRFRARTRADATATAAAELANAYRILDRLPQAARMIDRALEWWRSGSRDPRLLARIGEYSGAILCHLRRFPEALAIIDAEVELWRALGDRKRAAWRLLARAVYTGYAGNPRGAISIFCGVLDSNAMVGDSEFALAAVHGAVWFMTDLGWFKLAERYLTQLRLLYEGVTDRLKILRLRWLEARIEAGTGDPEAALSLLAKARDGFADAGLVFPASLVAIDIALLWFGRRRYEEIERLAADLALTFRSIGIPREGVAAILLVQKAARARDEAATQAALGEAAALLPTFGPAIASR